MLSGLCGKSHVCGSHKLTLAKCITKYIFYKNCEERYFLFLTSLSHLAGSCLSYAYFKWTVVCQVESWQPRYTSPFLPPVISHINICMISLHLTISHLLHEYPLHTGHLGHFIRAFIHCKHMHSLSNIQHYSICSMAQSHVSFTSE